MDQKNHLKCHIPDKIINLEYFYNDRTFEAQHLHKNTTFITNATCCSVYIETNPLFI